MEFKDQKAIYLQLTDLICDQILSGRYPEGERLPSVRDYAAEVEVNVNTMVRTYDWLQQNEIVFQRRGVGYFVADGAVNIIMNVRRTNFFHQQLPDLFAEMKTLGITIDEVIAEYKRRPE